MREIYGIAYDGVSKRMIVAAQDTGTAFQASPNSSNYNAIGGGDGANAIVNDRSSRSESIIYYSAQSLGQLTRMTVNAQGVTTSSTELSNLNFASDDKSGGEDGGWRVAVLQPHRGQSQRSQPAGHRDQLCLHDDRRKLLDSMTRPR